MTLSSRFTIALGLIAGASSLARLPIRSLRSTSRGVTLRCKAMTPSRTGPAGNRQKGAPASSTAGRMRSGDSRRQRTATSLQRIRRVYAPEFGGYCAYAVSRGYTADIDPNAWRIVDGRLYLNYSKRVQKLWEEDVPGNIAKGRQNWPGVLAK